MMIQAIHERHESFHQFKYTNCSLHNRIWHCTLAVFEIQPTIHRVRRDFRIMQIFAELFD